MTDQTTSGSDYIDAAAFGEVLRAVVESDAIVTTGQGNEMQGLTVTAAASLCLELLIVLFCVNRNAEDHDAILESDSLSWNSLPVDQIEFAKRIATVDGSKGMSRFALRERRAGEYLVSDATAICLQFRLQDRRRIGGRNTYYRYRGRGCGSSLQ